MAINKKLKKEARKRMKDKNVGLMKAVREIMAEYESTKTSRQS